MDPSTAYTVASIVGSSAVGWYTGRRSGKAEILGTAANTVDILNTRSEVLESNIEDLKTKLTEKDSQIADLTGRVNVLAEMVTQRAAVAEVKEVVDRIASKLEC